MHELGMRPLDLLRAATVAGADICRQNTGELAPGRRADRAIHDLDFLDDPSRLVGPSGVPLDPDLTLSL